MTATDTDTDTIEKIKIDHSIKEPPLFKVIYINDEVTTMDFVVDSLVQIFDHDFNTAHELTMEIHHEGGAVVAVLPYELAEEKSTRVKMIAKEAGFPLEITIEEVGQ